MNNKINQRIQIKLLFVIAFICLVACNSSNEHDVVLNKNTTVFSKFPKEQNVSFKNLFEYNKGNPRSIHIVDSVLVLANSSRETDYIFYSYSLINKKRSKRFLKIGRGPSEAIGVSATGINNNTLWAYDITLKKMLTTNIKNILNDKAGVLFNEYSVKDRYFKMDLTDSLHALGVSLEKINSKMDNIDFITGKKMNSLGKFHKVPSDLPLGALKDAYVSEIYLKPSGGKVVLAYNFANAIEIFDFKTNTSFAVKGPDGFNVDFKVKNRNDYYYMGITDKTRKACINGTVTDKYIYLVYSGHDRKTKNSEYGMEVHIYDWNGTPIKKLILDRYVYTLGISNDGKTLYSYDLETGYVITANIN